MISTIPQAKAALLTLFTAAVEDPTEVWRNRPNQDHQDVENVYICDVRTRDEWKTVGDHPPRQREEKYAVAVDVEVTRDGTDGDGCEDRMWEIVGQLETVLEADRTIKAIPGVQWASFSAGNQTAQSNSDGWLCRMTLLVEVTARI